jgi:hypothetical protein
MSFCGLVAYCRFVERTQMRKVLAENKQFTMHALAVSAIVDCVNILCTPLSIEAIPLSYQATIINRSDVRICATSIPNQKAKRRIISVRTTLLH